MHSIETWIAPYMDFPLNFFYRNIFCKKIKRVQVAYLVCLNAFLTVLQNVTNVWWVNVVIFKSRFVKAFVDFLTKKIWSPMIFAYTYNIFL